MPRGVSALLLDIEGTTTPISFVYEVLFPFARERLETSCAGAGDEAGIADAVSVLRREYDEESRAGAVLPDFGDGAAYARYLMDQDRKSTGLKTLQGLIWEHGYKSGELRGQVFPDVAGALNNLGYSLFVGGQYAAARAYTEQALAAWALTLPPDHPNMSRPLTALTMIAESFGSRQCLCTDGSGVGRPVFRDSGLPVRHRWSSF